MRQAVQLACLCFQLAAKLQLQCKVPAKGDRLHPKASDQAANETNTTLFDEEMKQGWVFSP